MSLESSLEIQGYRLSARICPDQCLAVEHLPSRTNADAQILFCGGFHSTMQGNKAEAVMAHCRNRCLACTRFDYRGHGASDGDAVDLTLVDWLDDALTVIDSLVEAVPVIVIGSSMGAWLAVHLAIRRPQRVAGLLLVAAAPDFLQDRLEEALDDSGRELLASGGVARLPGTDDAATASPGWPVTRALIDSGRALSVLHGTVAAAITCPVRCLHGSDDDTASWQRAVELLNRTRSDDATLTLIRGGDHRLSNEQDLGRLRALIDELQAANVRRQHPD